MTRLLLLCAVALLAACAEPAPPLVASDVEVTVPVPGREMSAGYLVLTNNTDEPMRITAVRSPQFGAVAIHESRIADGISRMRELGELVVPARSSVTLERGGKHLMLMRPVDRGSTVTLEFLGGDGVLLSVTYTFATG